jgi:hypothetical protein
MRYLGRISGEGMLQCSGKDVARAAFSFDGYAKRPAGVSSCGEIRMAAPVLKAVFGRSDVQLLRCCTCRCDGRSAAHAGKLAQLIMHARALRTKQATGFVQKPCAGCLAGC